MMPARRPVHPVPTPASELLAWSDLTTALSGQPLPAVRARVERWLDEQEKVFAPLARAFRKRLAGVADDELAAEAVFIGLCMGYLKAFVNHAPSGKFYSIEAYAWHSLFSDQEAFRSIELGLAPQFFFDFPEQSLERSIANGSLLITREDYDRFLELRPPSRKAVEREAAKIVKDHIEKPVDDVRMTKAEFTSELRSRLPKCSKSEAVNAWANSVPNMWRKPGAPRKTPRQQR